MKTKLMMLVVTTLLLTACGSTNRSDEEQVTRGPTQGGKMVDSAAGKTELADTSERVDGDGSLSLSQTTFIIEEGANSAELRLYLRNSTEVAEVIDHVDPSCGCILTTVQSTIARPGDSAMIYVALLTEQMSRTQPYTVDVYLVSRPASPLRLTIWHRSAYTLEYGDQE